MNIDSHDCLCTVNEAELFEPIPKQVTLDESRWEDIYPINNITTDGPIEFEINGTTSEFIDLNNTMLKVEVKIVNGANNNNIANTDVVAPINNWLHSMFADAMLTVNDTVVEGGHHMYPFKAYLSNLLVHNRGSKETQLQASGWYKDTTEHMNVGTNNNKGFIKRKALTATSTVVQLCGPLLFDLFLQNKFLLQNTNMRIKLLPSKPEFQTVIYTANTVADRAESVKVVISSAVLFIKRVKGLPSLMNQIEDTLNMQNAVYPIQRTEMITFTIPNGTQSFNKQSLFTGQLPKAIFIAMLRNDAYNGAYAQNPFNFQHFSVNNITLYYPGGEIKPFTPNFERNLYACEYMFLLQALGQFNRSEDIDLTMKEFGNGYTIFAFNLTPDQTIAGHTQIARDGDIRLEMKFSAPTTNTINVVAMGIFDGRVSITKQRKVICDWKS